MKNGLTHDQLAVLTEARGKGLTELAIRQNRWDYMTPKLVRLGYLEERGGVLHLTKAGKDVLA